VSYDRRIDREHPSLVLLLIDQSGSMSATMGGDHRTRAEAVADAVNGLLFELVLRCVKDSDEGPRPYYDVGVIGYSIRDQVGPAFSGGLEGRRVVSSVDLAEHPLRLEEKSGVAGSGVRRPVWVEPVAIGSTPMCEALDLAGTICAEWIEAHPHSFPPVVINMTDGVANDGDPARWAERLTELATTDGRLLLFNASISTEAGGTVAFPASPDDLPSDEAKGLFAMSSELPSFMVDAAATAGHDVTEGARGFVHNADVSSIVSFLRIGTATVHALPSHDPAGEAAGVDVALAPAASVEPVASSTEPADAADAAEAAGA
jgi:hypothetical protein